MCDNVTVAKSNLFDQEHHESLLIDNSKRQQTHKTGLRRAGDADIDIDTKDYLLLTGFIFLVGFTYL